MRPLCLQRWLCFPGGCYRPAGYFLRQHARLSVDIDGLSDEADLYAAGLTSHATVSLMVALEDHFGVEFPERMLRRRSFESVASISAAIAELTG